MNPKLGSQNSKTELNTSLIPKIALVVVTMRKIIAKAGKQIIKLCWTDSNVFAHRNVDASADEEIKSIVARRLAGDKAAKYGAVPVKIAVKIAVRSAEQGLNKWFEVRSTEFYDGPYVVSKQIATNRYRARSGTVRWVGDRKVVRGASVALKIALDSDVLAEIEATEPPPPFKLKLGMMLIVEPHERRNNLL